jgi:integration host factor subunit alpha
MKETRDNTTKKIIADSVRQKIGLPTSYSTKILDDMISILLSNIIIKEKIKIKHFGTFFLKKKKKRIGRNPQNKISHVISERNVVTFKISDLLKKKINYNVKKKY